MLFNTPDMSFKLIAEGDALCSYDKFVEFLPMRRLKVCTRTDIRSDEAIIEDRSGYREDPSRKRAPGLPAAAGT